MTYYHSYSLQELQTLHDRIPTITAIDIAVKYFLRTEIVKREAYYKHIEAQRARVAAWDLLPWYRKIFTSLLG